MRSAIIAALVAAVVASGGTAAASSWLNGHRIRPHSIPPNRLTRPPILSGVVRVVGQEYVVQPGAIGFGLASCPHGYIAVGGGGAVVAEVNPDQTVGFASTPLADLSGWTNGFDDRGTTPATVQAFAVCAPGSLASN